MAETFGIEYFVDYRSVLRGTAYATQNRSIVLENDGATITAITEGSGNNYYRQSIDYVLSDGQLEVFDGSCTCPVAYNCKHCVSAFYIAFGIGALGVTTASNLNVTPKWQRMLEQVFPDTSQELQALALAVEFTAPTPLNPEVPAWQQYRHQGSVSLVPMRMGKRGRWIKTGVSINDVRYGVASGIRRDHVEVVRQLIEVCETGVASYARMNKLSLTSVKSGLLGQALRDVLDAGVALISGLEQAPVIIDPDPVEPVMELRDDGVLTLSAYTRHPRVPSDAVTIGKPAQAAMWYDGELHLAWFDPVPSTEWDQLKSEKIVVPASERRTFDTTYYPLIADRFETTNYTPPPSPEPTLMLKLNPVGADDDPKVAGVWSWVYEASDLTVFDAVPLWSEPDYPRDVAKERPILEKITPIVADIFPEIVDEQLLGEFQLQGESLLSLRELIDRLNAERVRVVDFLIPEFRRASELQVDADVDEGRDWLDLRLRITVDGTEVKLRDVIGPIVEGMDYTFIDGAYVDLTSPDLTKLSALIDEARNLGGYRESGVRVPKVRRSWWEELLDLDVVAASEHAWFDAVRTVKDPEPVELPKGLNATLRPYQKEGFEWLAHLRDSGLGGVLADDMGLGKTLQILAMILRDRQRQPESGPWLVVAPTSVVGNWAAEAAKFTPSLNVVVIESTAKRRQASLAEVVEGADIVVTSYTLLRLEDEEYRSLGFTGLVLDEAQNVKNYRSKGFAAAKNLGAPTVFAVTGTPIENNLQELWAMFTLSAPGLLGSSEKFGDTFRKPIEKAAGLSGGASQGTSRDGSQGAPSTSEEEKAGEELMATLRRRISPFFLRRTKSAVALDLPPKQEQVLKIDLAAEHRRMYDVHLEKERQRVLGLSDDDRIEILSALTRLRQLAIDPRLADESSAAPPSKINELIPLLANLVAEGHNALVFSQFTRFLKLIAKRLDAEGIAYLYLDGTTRHRPKLIRSFQEGEAPIFLISLKAGGTGLNLTMADYAILTDPWWNPAAEEQAVDRAHRIGQTRPVHVYRLVSRGTIEEKVVALQDAKRRLLAVISDDGGVGTGALSAAELRALLA
ncbi:DEAD/DEAH box helicase [Trueperella bialowiezensis]|uniref:ATP-dependent helicase HepA n=1 Tax=Trueperella bialowiezensis TaxID=312285 RepID=A0A3S4V5N8_9ACTO|nr:DEAD/DEAH box helicase [Trueperella bialowiezensis]VEI12638.1 ATP-dependent helicase HepA [Trueperella bialowiezensis]